MKAAGGIDDEGVAAHDAGFAEGFLGETDDQVRAGGFAFLIAFVEFGLNGFCDNFELLAGGGTIDVDRDEHGAVTTLFEPGGELAAGGGFAGALQAGHENDGGRLRGKFEAGGVFAEEGDQLVANDLDDLLGGRERGEDLSADGFDADLLDEVAGDVEVDVGFEQGSADFAQGFGDVFFSERALAAEGFEGALEFVGEVFKHDQDKCIAEVRTGGVRGIPPFRQKKGERMGHGAFMGNGQGAKRRLCATPWGR